MKLLVVILCFLFFAGCATKKYVPPKNYENIGSVFTNVESLFVWNGVQQ